MALLVATSIGGWANAIPPQVTLSLGTTGNVDFTNTGPSLSLGFTGTSGQCGHANCVSGNALLDPLGVLGRYWMWMTGGSPALTSLGGGDYNVAMGTTSIYLEVKLGPNGDGSLGDLITTVSLTALHGGMGTTPQFDGTFLATTRTIDFSSGFSSSIPGDIDFTVKLPRNTPLSSPIPVGHSISGYISSGELVPSIPEPSTLALLGSGVLGLAGVIRRKMAR